MYDDISIRLERSKTSGHPWEWRLIRQFEVVPHEPDQFRVLAMGSASTYALAAEAAHEAHEAYCVLVDLDRRHSENEGDGEWQGDLRVLLPHCPECRAVGDGDRHKPWCSKLSG